MASEDDKSLYELFAFSEKDERHALMADVIAITLAWQIRQMRAQRGWSQGQLAEKAKLSIATVNRLERPEQILHCTLSSLLLLAKAFDVALFARFSSWKTWMETMLGEAAFTPPPPYSEESVAQLVRK